MYIEKILKDHPIIAAIKDVDDLEQVPKDKIDVIFILRSRLSDLNEIIEKAMDLDVLVFLHIDMVKGIGKDKEAIRYLAQEIGIDGIMTTKSYLIKAAKKENLITIQRLFMLDSESLKTGVNIVKSTNPDLIEVLPGLVVPTMVDKLKSKLDIPIIAGGLVRNREQVSEILDKDVTAISTSQTDLWENYK
ncbi:glycerol-3-phosphate responsive antiterminator [Halanaerobacter jeridensis]|uniref:Glycerol uptake operon antiterminator n=1 Tax=Halanaerobacter jeridensis TaxID=706427 RepID=A0A938XRI4_9FIRM|nr:glycerol-3-phosphate responsive antiterminator [Halanaerobacter jeridensis]MBM7556120.1 glycerol uptake operon antiterminator [Halanaerobacter jeridensis]